MNKSQKISSSQMDRELDRISNLPKPLIDKILSLVPTRDAVRTSILSRNWRNNWTTISKLDFYDNVGSSELVKIIDKVLLLHSGPIDKFMLSHKQYKATTTRDIDIWIHHLSKASMKELTLDLWRQTVGPRYKLPSSLFYCEGLTSLRLCNCSVNLPVSPTFRGFKNLKILYLQRVKLNDECWVKFLSGSNVLEDLSLINYRLYGNLNFETTKLKHFCYRGVLIGISLNSTFCSPSFHMEFHEDNSGWSDAPKSYINLLKFIAPLRSVETLKLDGDVLKYLSIQEVPSMLAEPLLLLKNLFISGVNFKSVKEQLIILCLLRSAPNLKQVKLLAAEKGDIVEVDDCSGIEIYDSHSTFAYLNSVSLTGIGDHALEMGFIGVLLSSSPALKKMTIKAAKSSKLPSGRGEYKLLKNLMRLQCPSSQVELILL